VRPFRSARAPKRKARGKLDERAPGELSMSAPARKRGSSAAKAGERVSYAANPLLVVSLPAWRSRVLVLLLFAGFVALAVRAVYLQGGGRTDFLQRQGEVRYQRTLDVPGTRGKVIDRNGVVLAASVPARSIWAIPDDVEASAGQLAQLSRLLQMPLAEVRRRLADEDRKFVFLRRQVDLDVARRIETLKIPGIHQSPEFRRHYPEGAAVAHVTGFTNVEDRGQEGVELSWDATLAARTGSRRVIKDRLGNVIEEDWLLTPADGADVRLSIDSRIQFIAFSALKNAVEVHKAKAGAVVVLDSGSGEILALANWPSFDPNVRGSWSKEAVRNRVVTDTFEPGSTMKPFTIAAALDAGKVTPSKTIQTAPGKLAIGGHVIGDAHAYGLLTVAEVVAKSSNVGTAKIALDMPAAALWDVYTKVGFGQAPRVAAARSSPVLARGPAAGGLFSLARSATCSAPALIEDPRRLKKCPTVLGAWVTALTGSLTMFLTASTGCSSDFLRASAKRSPLLSVTRREMASTSFRRWRA